jgi:hypothetical protein
MLQAGLDTGSPILRTGPPLLAGEKHSPEVAVVSALPGFDRVSFHAAAAHPRYQKPPSIDIDEVIDHH